MCVALVLAVKAADLALDLALEDALNEGVAYLGVGLRRPLCQLGQLLGEQLEQVAHELVGVLLPPEAEALGDRGQAVRDRLRRVRGAGRAEGPLDELLKRADEAEAGAALLRVLPLLEVLVQLGRVHEALQDLVRGTGTGTGTGTGWFGYGWSDRRALGLVFGRLGQG